MVQLIMTPELFREFGIYVCDDSIISTHRNCPKKLAAILSGKIKVAKNGENEAKNEYFKSIITGNKIECKIPRLSNGDKSTDELRIVDRARATKAKLFNEGVHVSDINSNIPLVALAAEYNGIRVWFEDVIDVFPVNYNKKLSSLVLYLTSNVENVYFSPSYPDKCSDACWGEPRFVDKTRALVDMFLTSHFKLEHQVRKYKDDYRHPLIFNPGWNIKYNDPNVVYVVSDTRPDKPGTVNSKVLSYDLNPQRIGLCDDLAREASIVYNTMALQGWDQIYPNQTSCENCPFKCKMTNGEERI